MVLAALMALVALVALVFVVCAVALHKVMSFHLIFLGFNKKLVHRE